MTAQRSQQGSGTPILSPEPACGRQAKEPIPSASGVEGSSCKSTPHPAYGSELSTGGGRLVRAWSAMEPARHPFPVSSTAPHY